MHPMYLQYFVLQFGSFAIPEQITFLRQKVPTLGDLHCWHMMQNLAFDAVEEKKHRFEYSFVTIQLRFR